jgi:hypothetical protein
MRRQQAGGIGAPCKSRLSVLGNICPTCFVGTFDVDCLDKFSI